MDDQCIYMSYALPDNLACKPSEYMTSGRFFASVWNGLSVCVRSSFKREKVAAKTYSAISYR